MNDHTKRTDQHPDLGPDYLGRCDICGEPIDLEHAGDTLVTATREDFGTVDDDDVPVDVPPAEAIKAVLDALDATCNTYDDMLATALREHDGYAVHDRCLDKTSLLFGDPDALDEDTNE